MAKADVDFSPTLGDFMNQYGNPTELVQAWKSLIAAADAQQVDTSLGTYHYDLVDVTRQVILDFYDDVFSLFKVAYARYQNEKLNTTSRVVPALNMLLDMIVDTDSILGTDVNFLLGVWLESAKSWSSDPTEIANLEFNARNQITLWGPDGQINDYASKHWQGLVGDYYFGRWQLFSQYITKAITSGQPCDFNALGRDLFQFSTAWNHASNLYPTKPQNDTLVVSRALLSKYTVSHSNYTIKPNTDIVGNLFQAWTRDINQLQMICDLDNTCIGFNSNGFLKNGTKTQTGTSTTLYLKPTTILV